MDQKTNARRPTTTGTFGIILGFGSANLRWRVSQSLSASGRSAGQNRMTRRGRPAQEWTAVGSMCPLATAAWPKCRGMLHRRIDFRVWRQIEQEFTALSEHL